MTIRFIDEEGKHRIVETTELEVEGVYDADVKDGKWVFKDERRPV